MGIVNVEGMLNSMSSTQFYDWMAYFKYEPWGSEVEETRTGLLTSVLAEVNRDRDKRKESYSALDFMPNFSHKYKDIDKEKTKGKSKIRTRQQWNNFRSNMNMPVSHAKEEFSILD